MLDKLNHIDYWRHIWRPFWIFSNAQIVRRTPGSDSAPPNYQKYIWLSTFPQKCLRDFIYAHSQVSQPVNYAHSMIN